jgi:hypothetical protein
MSHPKNLLHSSMGEGSDDIARKALANNEGA